MAADHFCLRWNNYQSNMVSELDSLRSDEDLVDVTLSCDGHLLKAHKVILSACSSYFRNVFKDNPCKHPVVILKDVNYEDVEALLSFVYQGVVYISEKKLASFLQTAELLQIRGLTGAATTMKEATFSDTSTSSQNKTVDKNNVLPPPQLLTANLINSWKQQGVLNTCSAGKSPMSNPPSPPVTTPKRRKFIPNKMPLKNNFECSDTNSNQDYSEAEGDVPTVKTEVLDSELRPEDDCNSMDDVSRGESGREDDVPFYDNMESDETEEESGEIRKAIISNSEKLSGTSNAPCSSLFSMIANYSSSQSSSEQNSPASDTRLGRRPCPLCQKIISNKSNLLKHMRIRHSEEHNPAGCTVCNKVFKNKYSLRAHINIYHKEMGANNLPLSTYLQNAQEYNSVQHQSNVNTNTEFNNQSSVSLYTSDPNYVLSTTDSNSYALMKEHIMNQFNVSNPPLT